MLKSFFQCSLVLVLAGSFGVIPAGANSTIRDLKTTQGLTITGRVIGFGEADENEFIVSDGTANLVVDAGPRWWKSIDLSLGETISVTGELDKEEFDAFTIRRQNGEVINVRPAQGAPPWAGRRHN
ncbi:MAG: DNA-binding protein [Chloroflexaceae bacterium]|nr:DNA-binding protein [Chloroflexaceae bacterium]